MHDPVQILRCRGGKKFGGFYVEVPVDRNPYPEASVASMQQVQVRLRNSRELAAKIRRPEDPLMILMRAERRHAEIRRREMMMGWVGMKKKEG